MHRPLIVLLIGLLLAQTAQAQSLASRLRPLIEAHEGELAVAVKHLKTGESFAEKANEPMPTASLIKLPIMVEAYRQAAEGQLNLEDKVTFTAEDKTPGSGMLSTQFSPGATFTLRDAIRLMIAYSDNSATNLVLAKTGLAATNAQMEKLELPNTKVHAFVFRPMSSIAPERSRQFGLGSTTAGEMIRLVELIHAKQLISPEASGAMLEHLRACQDKRLSKLLPADVKVAHKTGSVAAVRTDAGLIEAKSGPIAICVLTRNNKDQRWTEENAAEVLTSKIARAVYDHFEPAAVTTAPQQPAELRTGATGDLVQALQRTLNARSQPSPNLSVDGDFGPSTESAVKKFQTARGLEASGVVGPETFKALGALIFSDAPQPSPEEINSQKLTVEPREALAGPPATTCKSWIIADAKTGQTLHGHKESDKLDFASTTKMMTAYIVCELAKADPKVLTEELTFSEAADKTGGSTADVRAGEKLPVGELLYGLLLPSGNDAAQALAEHFGPRFQKASSGREQASGGREPTEENRGPASGTRRQEPASHFIAEMNRRAAELGMAATHYENPHGLPARGHQSTCHDLATLARAAMANPLFRQYVGTRQRGAKVIGTGGYERNILWKNTNQLLGTEGYLGVKTGTTNAAGACLVSYGERDGRELIVVVLGSTSGDARYVDARNLFRWAWSQTSESQPK
jgi:serine-type D-Ala-D-Ala carboxypeptidase (penicillin-binding protein 5/6)